MAKKNIVTGLEIGNGKLGMVAAEISPEGGFDLLGASKVRCGGGVKNGSVVDLDSVTEAIVKLTDELSQRIERKIDSAFVNISGLNIKVETANPVIMLTQKGSEISERHVKELIESCKILSVPLDRHLLYLSPLEYIVDGQDGIENPVGLYGARLEAAALVITAPYSQVQNIVKTVNSAGIEVDEVILTTLANSYCVLTEDEKKLGSVLIDFKTDLTEISIFKGDSILFFDTIPNGQADITNDIARQFNVPFDLAEAMKLRYGFLNSSGTTDERNRETIPMDWMGASQNISRGELNKIISDRLGETLNAVLKTIKEFKDFNNAVKSGAVMTGGCVAMEGFLEWTAQKVGFSTRPGSLPSLNLKTSGADSYITSFGLARYGFNKRRSALVNPKANFFKKVFQRADAVLSDYF